MMRVQGVGSFRGCIVLLLVAIISLTLLYHSAKRNIHDSKQSGNKFRGKESLDGFKYSLQFQKELREKIVGRFSKLKNCVIEKAQKSKDNGALWKNVSNDVTECTKKHSTVKPDNFMSFNMGRFNEKKYFLNPKKNWKANPACKFLTIGIGGDTKVEKEFHKKYKECGIYGIEASPDQHADFSSFGAVIPHAVGMEHGQLTMRIRNPKGLYEPRKVDIVPLPEAIAEYTDEKVFYFSTIDLEGFEYDIMQNLQDNGVFSDSGLVFCQIDAELHDPSWKKGFSAIDFLVNFLKISPYAAVHANDFGAHRKITFIRADGHEECENIFQFSNYV